MPTYEVTLPAAVTRFEYRAPLIQMGSVRTIFTIDYPRRDSLIRFLATEMPELLNREYLAKNIRCVYSDGKRVPPTTLRKKNGQYAR